MLLSFLKTFTSLNAKSELFSYQYQTLKKFAVDLLVLVYNYMLMLLHLVAIYQNPLYNRLMLQNSKYIIEKLKMKH